LTHERGAWDRRRRGASSDVDRGRVPVHVGVRFSVSELDAYARRGSGARVGRDRAGELPVSRRFHRKPQGWGMGQQPRPQSCRRERCHDDCVGPKRRAPANEPNGLRCERVQVPVDPIAVGSAGFTLQDPSRPPKNTTWTLTSSRTRLLTCATEKGYGASSRGACLRASRSSLGVRGTGFGRSPGDRSISPWPTLAHAPARSRRGFV
jgi:hypothetical protein